MSEVDFRKLMDKKADDVKRPVPIPGGTYVAIVLGYEFVTSAQKGTPGVRFKFKPTEAKRDVDPNDLEGVDLSKKELRDDFWLTEAAEYRIVDFYKACGLNTEGRILGDMLDEVKGAYVVLDVGIRPNKDKPEEPGWNEIKGYAQAA